MKELITQDLDRAPSRRQLMSGLVGLGMSTVAVKVLAQSSPAQSAMAPVMRLSQNLDGDRAHSEPGQTRYQLPAGRRVVQVVRDQFFHGVPPSTFDLVAPRLEAQMAPVISGWLPNWH